MTRAEEKVKAADKWILSQENGYEFRVRDVFVAGYETAEKDLALTWKDIRKIVVLFSEVSFEFFDTKSANEMCEETLTRFKQYKEASHD